jgi:hypothetical protein
MKKITSPKSIPYRYTFLEDYHDSKNFISLKSYKHALGNDAYMTIQTKDTGEAPVYVINYAYLFSHQNISLNNLNTGKIENVSVKNNFLNHYLKGISEGKAHFNQNFKVTGEILYGKHSKRLERTLHHHFYHSSFQNFSEGWNYYQKWVSSVLTEVDLYRWGFYAGHICELNKMITLHPLIFAKFNECNSPGIGHNTSKLKELNITLHPEIINPIVSEIGHLFNDNFNFEEALKGKPIEGKLNFKGQQNQLVELFRRLHTHQKISESKAYTAEWLCKTFRYCESKGRKYKDLNYQTIYDVLASGKSEPNKLKRICVIPELPYKKR